MPSDSEQSATEQQSTPDGNWYVVVFGIKCPEERLTLAPGLTLLPISGQLTFFDLAAAGGSGFHEWALLGPLCANLNCEIETAKDSDIIPGYDNLNRAWLSTAMLVLRGFSRTLGIAASAYSWNVIAGHQKRTADIFKTQLAREGVEAAVYKSDRQLPKFHGQLLDFHTKILTDRGARDGLVTAEDACWISDNFSRFNTLASESKVFELALQAAIDWRYSSDPRIAVSRLWAGIEALIGINSELVYRLSNICASLLADRGPDRVKKFRAVKKLYSLRSKAVHGEQLDPEQLTIAMDDSFRLLRDLLVLVTAKGKVWTSEELEAIVLS
jgi:hypothetical protein